MSVRMASIYHLAGTVQLNHCNATGIFSTGKAFPTAWSQEKMHSTPEMTSAVNCVFATVDINNPIASDIMIYSTDNLYSIESRNGERDSKKSIAERKHQRENHQREYEVGDKLAEYDGARPIGERQEEDSWFRSPSPDDGHGSHHGADEYEKSYPLSPARNYTNSSAEDYRVWWLGRIRNVS